jgi:ribosomal protein S8
MTDDTLYVKDCNKVSSDQDTQILQQYVYRILNRRLKGVDNPILRELITTDLVHDLLNSLYEQGYVRSFKYGLQIEDPDKEEAVTTK